MFDLRAPIALVVVAFQLSFCTMVASQPNGIILTYDWKTDHRPMVTLSYEELADSRRVFRSNVDTDDFKLLWTNQDSLYIGARDRIVKLFIRGGRQTLYNQTFLGWAPSETGFTCQAQNYCGNYIWLMQPIYDNGTFLICGTNSDNPNCSFYDSMARKFDKNLENNVARAMYKSPKVNATAFVADKMLFATTGRDNQPMIFVKSLEDSFIAVSNPAALYEVEFVTSFQTDDTAFFFYKEYNQITALHCGKILTSVVARFCKNDTGTANSRKSHDLTTFYQANIDCSISDPYRPFSYNEIQAVAHVKSGFYVSEEHGANKVGQELIYGVFNTPNNGPGGSAVCVYNYSDVQRVFDGKVSVDGQNSRRCDDTSSEINDKHIQNPKMEETVRPIGGKPIFYFPDAKSRLTQILVDSNFDAIDGRKFDVIFLGTDDGRLIKLVNHWPFPIVYEELQVLPRGEAVTKLQLYSWGQWIMVLSRTRSVFIPIKRCQSSYGNYSRKTRCISIDPYCQDYIRECLRRENEIEEHIVIWN